MPLFRPKYRDKNTREIRESSTWWYEFHFNGQRIRESTKQANKRVAETMMAAKRTALAKGEVGIAPKKKVPTLAEFAPEFVKQIRADCANKPATVAFYESKLGFLLKHEGLASRRLDTIDEEVIDTYKQQRAGQLSNRKRLRSRASVNRELATLRRLLRMARRWKLIPSVPEIKLFSGELGREFVLNDAQEKRYLEAAPADLRDFAMLSIDTGLRVGEALSLEWPQLHMEATEQAKFGYVHIPGVHSKNSKPRNVPLTRRVVKMLNGRASAKTGLVFHRPDGTALYQTWLNQQHVALRELLELPEEFVPHSFRHTYGTRLGESGADAFTIKELMGHSSITVSQKYVHPTPESREAATRRMDARNEKKRRALSRRGKTSPKYSPKSNVAKKGKCT